MESLFRRRLRQNGKFGGGGKIDKPLKSRRARLEPLESRELLAADVLTAASLVSSSDVSFADFATFDAAETLPVDVSLPPDVSDASGETLSTNAPEVADFAVDGEVDVNAAKTWTVTSTADSETTSGTLRYAIKNAASGDTITFASSMNGKTITLAGSQLEITKKSLTIDASNLADGVTINGAQKSRCLYVSNNYTSGLEVKIKNVDFTDGKALDSSGGAIFSSSVALILENCDFTGNFATKDGGAINQASSSLKTTSCNFTNNVASTNEGGAVWSSGKFTATSCNFTQNTAPSGAVFLENSATIDKCKFDDNDATGLYFNSSAELVLSNSTLSNNSKYGLYFGDYYDGLSATITNVEIKGNSERGVYCSGVSNGAKSLSMTDCEISDNGSGGFYLDRTAAQLTRCRITNNVADKGGGLYVYAGTATLIDCEISGNAAEANSTSDGGGIYATNSAEVTFDVSSGRSLLANNTANRYGGGVFSDSGKIYFTDVEITGNYAVNCGGGVYTGNVAEFRNCLIAENRVSTLASSSGYGGGIYNYLSYYYSSSASELTTINCTIAKNKAYYGGGIYNEKGGSSSCVIFTSYNTIVAQNSSRSGSADVVKNQTKSILRGCNSLSSFTDWESSDTFASTGNLAYSSSKPLFVDAAASNYALATGSQAIDKGENDYAVDVDGKTLKRDVAGKTRIVGNSVDVGAYEYQGAVKTPLTAVTISNDDLYVGTLLFATVSPEDATASYQWYRVSTSGTSTAITGATKKTYFLDDADVGYCVKVVATGTGDYSGSVSAKTTAVVEEPPAEPVELEDVTIIGDDLYVGTTLTATVSPGGATASYQWYRVSTKGTATKITGATKKTYVLTASDVGYCVKVVATGTGDYSGSASDKTTAVVSEKPVEPTELDDVTITCDDLYVGTTLTATVSPANATAVYQWYRVSTKGTATKIDGATNKTFVLTASEIGFYIKVVATGSGDYSGSASDKTTAVVSEKPAETIALQAVRVWTTQPTVGETIITTLTPLDATASYQWRRTDLNGETTAIVGATGGSYTPTAADVGCLLSVVATGTGKTTGTKTATISRFTTGSLTSVSISQSGAALNVGTVLTASVVPSAATATCRWYRVDAGGNETEIADATAFQYVATEADAGCRLKVEATGSGYWKGSRTAQTTSAVRSAKTALTRIGTSTSQPQAGTTITTTLSPKGATATYQWYRVDATTDEATEIDGATESSYTPTNADVGYKIRVTAVGCGAYKGTVTATHSKPTLARPTTPLTKVGTSTSAPQVGYEITARLYVGTTVKSDATATYQWYRVDRDGVWKTIDGATESSYAPVAADVDYYIAVKATGTDAYSGTVSVKHSTATAVVKVAKVSTSTTQPTLGVVITARVSSPANAKATFQWYRVDDSNMATTISGATGATYTPTAADVGYRLQVCATGTDGCAGYATVTHAAKTIDPSTPVVETLTRVGTSTSQPTVGVKITTTLYVGAAKKLDSGATASYQWYRVNAKGVATAISGATASSYTPTADDIGFKIRVTAKGTGTYSGTVTATHSKATISGKSSSVFDDAFAAFDWEDDFAEF